MKFILCILIAVLCYSCKKTKLNNELCDCAATPVEMQADTFLLSIPNIFTPNGDGINDLWFIGRAYSLPNFHVKVIDEGVIKKTVFESNSVINVWDGTYNGKQLPNGKYFYEITIGGNKKTGCVCIWGTSKPKVSKKLEGADCINQCTPPQEYSLDSFLR
mgnify:CR=1 FL=1